MTVSSCIVGKSSLISNEIKKRRNLLWVEHSDVILFIVIQRQSHTHFELLANVCCGFCLFFSGLIFFSIFLESGGGVGGGVFLSTLKRFQITFIVDKGHDLESVFLCKTNKYE